MKIKTIIAALVLGLAAVACSPKENVPAEAKQYLPNKAEVDSVSYLIGINFGTFVKSYDFGEDLNYSEIINGIKDFLAAEGDQYDPEFVNQFKINPDEMNRLFNSFLEKRAQYNAVINDAKEAEFFDQNITKEGMQVTESGLQYLIIEEGDVNNKPSIEDQVTVKYTGTLLDGTVFDSTQGDETATFPLNGVIPGWSEGLQLIGKGGKIQLFIPSSLGYGPRGTQGIPGGSILIFDVELVSVIKAEAAE